MVWFDKSIIQFSSKLPIKSLQKIIFLAEAKLNWAFKLYDVDNDGFIDLKEMSIIIEMMDDLDGVKPGIS